MHGHNQMHQSVEGRLQKKIFSVSDENQDDPSKHGSEFQKLITGSRKIRMCHFTAPENSYIKL